MTEKTKKKIVFWFWIALTAPFALLFLTILGVWIFAEIPSFEDIEHPDNKLATLLIADDGTHVLNTFHEENRTYVPYDELSPYLIHAAVSTEDSRFYDHSGIDFKGLARVAFKTLLMHDSSQGGGSTITQQLVKNLYKTRQKEKGVEEKKKGGAGLVFAKFKEWITAVKIERTYTKDEILALYLNTLPFGENAFGIRSGSETFFGKEPSDLSIEEAATLVGMIKAQTAYNPVKNPEQSLSRRNLVIKRMEKHNFLTAAEADSVCQLPLNTDRFRVLDHNAGSGTYFRDMLKDYMSAQKPRMSNYETIEDYAADSLRWEMDDLYGWLNKNTKANGEKYNLYTDGLKIYTTVNTQMQKFAEEAVAEHLGKNLQIAFDKEMKNKPSRPYANGTDKATVNRSLLKAAKSSDLYKKMKKRGVSHEEIMARFDKPEKMRVFAWNSKGYVDTTMTPNDSIRYYKSFLRAGFVAIEPLTGHVKAYVGGPNYAFFKYDNLRQSKHQVGSTIKPFLYTLAMQEGLSPCHKVVNVSQTFALPDGNTWTPRSTDKEEWIGKTVTLKWGLTHSSNNISAYLMGQFGPHSMAQMMRKMGVYSHIDEVLSLCVGSAEVYPMEMVTAYNTFPSKGVYSTPLYVTRIEDNQGNVLSEFSNSKREAISEKTAYLMINLMEGVVNSGTGSRLRSTYGLKGQIAGKTGTTNDNSDGWFIGYTPKITAGAWVGGDEKNIHFQSLALGGGSNMALPIWGIFMKKCLAAHLFNENDRFTAPTDFSVNLNCPGGDIFDTGAETETGEEEGETEQENNYFE